MNVNAKPLSELSRIVQCLEVDRTVILSFGGSLGARRVNTGSRQHPF